MKLKKATHITVAVAALLFGAAQFAVKAQWDYAQNTTNEGIAVPPDNNRERPPFGDRPLYEPPPDEDGDGQKILPAHDGFWIFCGLAMMYGFVCRRRREKR